jgi:hypothetical protein
VVDAFRYRRRHLHRVVGGKWQARSATEKYEEGRQEKASHSRNRIGDRRA